MFKRASGVILPPPLIYLIFILVAWALAERLPIDLPANAWTEVAGWSLIGAGVLLMGWAALLMRRHRTTVNPYGKPSRLLEEGPFGFSRNPIYLADTLIYAGIGLLLASLWPWLLLPLLILCMQGAVIVHEERLLDELFGDTYRAYRQRVRRWL
jgi:protein-S-isoprenylcysteine O-methyltransferase Ste14